MKISTYIRTCCAARDITVSELSRRIGKTKQGMNQKLTAEYFSTRDLQEIANALGCDLSVRFIDRATGKPLF